MRAAVTERRTKSWVGKGERALQVYTGFGTTGLIRGLMFFYYWWNYISLISTVDASLGVEFIFLPSWEYLHQYIYLYTHIYIHLYTYIWDPYPRSHPSIIPVPPIIRSPKSNHLIWVNDLLISYSFSLLLGWSCEVNSFSWFLDKKRNQNLYTKKD